YGMTRLILITIVVLAALWVLLGLGVLPQPVELVVAPIVGMACSLALPAIIVTSYAAPGLFRDVADDARDIWHRVGTRVRAVHELQRKIAQLDRPYHMQQLGLIYAAQGRVAKAKELFTRALAKDPESIEIKYQLALCHFAEKQYPAAAELLEQVQA